MTHKGLLFDLDGVIVDTAKYHYMAWKELANELGISFTEKDNERLKGVSRARSFQIILEIGNRTMTESEQEFYCNKKNEAYVQYILGLTHKDILPGVREFLENARAEGYGIALGSASKNAVVILERLGLTELFDAVIDGTKVTNAKPDPEVFTKGADALKLPYEACIVFEDAAAGIQAAHAANMAAVGVGKAEDLTEADYIIGGFCSYKIADLEQKL